MLRVIGCITAEHDLRLVGLAALLCLGATLAAVSLAGRARMTTGWARQGWIAATAFVVGGTIWSTHFIAMLAFKPVIPFGYDIGLTVDSILIAMGLCWVGLAIAYLPRAAPVGGAVLGLAISAMHYTGIAAMQFPGHFRWDRDYVIASIVVGVSLASVSTPLGLYGRNAGWRAVGAVLGALAICGMHFTGMAALTLDYDPTLVKSVAPPTLYWLAGGIFAITFAIVALAYLGALFDRHLARLSMQEAKRLRAHVAELEETKRKLEATSADLLTALQAASASNQAKSQFLATMSHELRTPLNAIIGFSEILASELFGPLGSNRYREYAKDVRDSGRHLLNLINDILDFSRSDAGQMHLDEEQMSLTRVIDEAVRMIRQQAIDANIAIECEIEPALPLVRADSRRVRQVLLNLLSNATKFTPEGGRICIGASAADGVVMVKVADNGIGIAPDDLPKALEQFGQIDSALSRKYEGAGLGLPLSQRLMELHGGTLTLESTVGVGTAVTIAFPPDRVLDIHEAA
ncbi:MAG TPA: MHYT domain-containing protein [Parvibaculum sp.]